MPEPVHVGDLRAQDEAARRLAKREYVRPLALEAGAGTGKTATLVARVVCWTLGTGWHRAERELTETGDVELDAIAERALEGVVAITFTEKAAAEMAERCAAAFQRIAAGELPVGMRDEDGDWDHLRATGSSERPPVERAVVQARAAALAEAQEALATRTIHAFCRSLLARHPLEAALAPGFEVDADGRLARTEARDVLEEFLRGALGEESHEDLLTLMTLGHGPPELEQTLIALHAEGARASDLERDPFDDASVAAFVAETRRRFRALREAGFDRLRDAKFGRNKHSPATRDALDASYEVVRSDPEPTRAGFARWLEDWLAPWEPSCRTRLKDWSQLVTKQKPTSDLEALGELTPAFAQAAAPLADWIAHARRMDVVLLSAARAVLRELLATLRERLTKSGVVSFETLLSATHALLHADAAVRREERGRIRLLLVDEFQDTDRTQCGIVRMLALDGPPDERPALFLVGDPKQSIYGWRRADLAAYEDFLEEVGVAGGERLPLAVNFRSSSPILDEVERLVAPVMQATPGVQPAFQPLLPGPDADPEPATWPDDRRAVEHWVSWARDPKSGRLAAGALVASTFEVEARAIARDLVDLRASGTAWRDVALLVRSSTSLDPYLDALRAEGIPYEVRGDKNYYRRREVVDAIALVRAVLDPSDHLALVTLLRSPWVGVPDAALAPLFSARAQVLFEALDGDDEEPLGALAALLPRLEEATRGVPGIEPVSGFGTALFAVARSIGVARAAFRAEPADRFVAVLRRRFQPEALSAARYQGTWRVPNLARFFRELVLLLDRHGGDGQAVLRSLRVDLATQRDAEEARPLAAAADAVQIMTIHRSKGLDFEHVYLPQLHKAQGGTGRVRFAFERREDRASYCLLGAPTPDFVEVEERTRTTEAAERVRLFYVAATRAKRRLVLTCDWKPRDEPLAWHAAKTFADLLPHRDGGTSGLLELRQRIDDETEREAAPLVDPEDVLWRLAEPYGRDPDDERRPAPEAGGASVPDAEQLFAGVAAVEAARVAGRLHARRPWKRVASAYGHALDAERDADASASPDAEDAAPRERGTPLEERAIALAVGTAVHAALEALPLPCSAADAFAAVSSDARVNLERDVPADRAAEAVERLERVLDGLGGGTLLSRLCDGTAEVVARELPILCAPDVSAEDSESAEERPVGYVSGSIDLLLRDRETRAWTVVDFKSDLVEESAVRALVDGYAPQLAIYGRALQAALGLERPPRLEAWLLALDRVVEV